jgi:WD40 repeat protein
MFPETIWRVKFSPGGGRIIALGDYGTVWMWTNLGNVITRNRGNAASVVSWDFSPNGRTMVTYNAEGAMAWNLVDGSARPVAPAYRQSDEAAIAVSHDGLSTAIAYPDGHLALRKQNNIALKFDTNARLSDIRPISDDRFLIAGEKGMAILNDQDVISQIVGIGDDIVDMIVLDNPVRAAVLLKKKNALHVWDVEALMKYSNVPDDFLLRAAKARQNELSR